LGVVDNAKSPIIEAQRKRPYVSKRACICIMKRALYIYIFTIQRKTNTWVLDVLQCYQALLYTPVCAVLKNNVGVTLVGLG